MRQTDMHPNYALVLWAMPYQTAQVQCLNARQLPAEVLFL